ncbi:MAG: SulP family inorganic anion transporter [Deltaproteobacteria bacterium]|nr:SulP family inorganic anion transporter [Deltaproteobacteria bacterium]
MADAQSSAALFRVIPALGSLRTYSTRIFADDLFAGLTVATVAVPQGLAYAIAAGLPPQHGLYTAIVMTAIGALFDSSKQLINGPTNAISIALFSALVAVPESERVTAAIFLSFLIGAIQLSITLLRLGDLTRYVSHSVIIGFTTGAAVLLFLSQLKSALGIKEGGSPEQSFIVRLFHTYASGPTPNAYSTLIAIGTIGVTLALARLNGFLLKLSRFRLPEFLVAIILSGLVVAALDLRQKGVAVVGALPEGLPMFSSPEITLRFIQEHASEALAIALLGLLEAVAMAKAIAAHTRQELDINQQCLSEAVANLGGSFFQCFPGSGSLTRSALNHQAGGRTQWSGVFSALGVGAAVMLFAPLAAFIPRAAIAGILLITAVKLVDRKDLSYFVRTSRFDTIIVGVTAFCAVAISVEFCLIVGVFLSFLLYVPRAGAINVSELVVVGDRIIRERAPGDPHCGKLAIFALEGEMFFGAAPDLAKHLEECTQRARAGAKVVVLRLRELRNPDAVCVQMLERWIEDMKARGAHVLLCGIRDDLERCLESNGAVERIGRENLFHAGLGRPSGLVRAVEHAYVLMGESRCATCPHGPAHELPSRDWHQQI